MHRRDDIKHFDYQALQSMVPMDKESKPRAYDFSSYLIPELKRYIQDCSVEIGDKVDAILMYHAESLNRKDISLYFTSGGAIELLEMISKCHDTSVDVGRIHDTLRAAIKKQRSIDEKLKAN